MSTTNPSKENEFKGLNAAIFGLKKELSPILKDKNNPFFKSSYADINSMLAQVEPLALKYGLLITQPIDTNGKANIVRTFITHVESGSHVMSSMTLPEDLKKAQDIGSAITYYRRYTLQSLLGMQATDDDGNGASGKTKKSVAKKSTTSKVESNDDF